MEGPLSTAGTTSVATGRSERATQRRRRLRFGEERLPLQNPGDRVLLAPEVEALVFVRAPCEAGELVTMAAASPWSEAQDRTAASLSPVRAPRRR